MIDHDGQEWLPSIAVSKRLGVDPHTIRNWVIRGRVRSHRIKGRRWVNVADAADREHAWRTRTRGGDR